jgi:hypothetical protein
MRWILAPFLLACSSTPPVMTQPDAVPDVVDMPDAGPSDAGFMPGDHPPMPQVISFGGPVIASPHLVPVSFDNDPLQGDIDTFVAAFDKTTYWSSVVAEYGIAKPTTMAPIHLPDVVPASVFDSDIQAFIQKKVMDKTLPAPDSSTLYVLFYPPGTTIDLNGSKSCATFHGYHNEVVIGQQSTAYAIVSRCSGIPEAPVTGIQYVSAVASHEVVEALTDPFVFSNPAFYEPDHDHIGFAFLSLAELGDMCALNGDAFYTPNDFPYTVQRIWSNALAKQGKDPCFPNAKNSTYVMAVPELDDAIASALGKTKGVKIPVGQEKTIAVDLFSDGPIDAWDVRAVEPSSMQSTLDLTLDRSTGTNGDKLMLTIKTKAKNATYGASPFVIVSRKDSQQNLYVGLVGY